MQPKNFSPHKRIESDFSRSINALLSKYLNISEDSPPSYVIRALSNLANTPAVLEDIARRLAARMVTQVRVSNARSWREAARQASRGREIYEALQNEMQGNVGARVRELVAENARLITSIPGKVREEVNREILGLEQQGLRPETITKYLLKRVPQITLYKARLIARTETGKAAEALTRARSEDLGINWAQWASAEDQRVRPSHRLMDKVLFSFSDEPNPETLAHEPNSHGPYGPGGIYNCRCTALPVISLDLISWPARVYTGGSIRRMTRGQFAELSGMRKRAA